MTTNINDIIRRGMGESYLLKNNLDKCTRNEAFSPAFMKKTYDLCDAICKDTSNIDKMIYRYTGFAEESLIHKTARFFTELDVKLREVMRGFFRGRDLKEITNVLKEYYQDAQKVNNKEYELADLITKAGEKAKAVIFTGSLAGTGVALTGWSSFSITNALMHGNRASIASGVALIIGSLLTSLFSGQFLIWLGRKTVKVVDEKAAEGKARECLEVTREFKNKWRPKLQELAKQDTLSRHMLNEIAFALEYVDEAEEEFKMYLKEPTAESFMTDMKSTLASWFGYGSKEELKARYEEMERDVKTTKVLKNAYIEETLTTSKKVWDVAINWLHSATTGGVAKLEITNGSDLVALTFSIASIFFFVKSIMSLLKNKRVLPGRLEEIEKIFTDLKEKYDVAEEQMRAEGKRIPLQMSRFRIQLGKMLSKISREKFDRHPLKSLENY